MFQTKVVEKIKTHLVFNTLFFRDVYDIIWENMVQPGRPQITIWRTPISRWIPKATNTLSDYVILIAFPLQQCL